MTRGLEQPGTSNKRQKREQVSVYDAVAGRAGYEGFLPEQRPSQHRDRASTSTIALPPEEVLFRRKGALERFEEDDIYSADRHLRNSEQQLPDSDLLKAIHAYASDFYGGATDDGGENDVKSLDETALLALGILLEEAAEETLGQTGHLALLEPSDDERHDGLDGVDQAISESESDLHRSQSSNESYASSEEVTTSESQTDSL